MDETHDQPDVFFKKTIPFKFAGANLSFRVSQDLFSSQDIDVGTRLLLRSIVQDPAFCGLGDADAVLDLGTGYGPIGLTLKRLSPGATVHLVDRDALAVEYARQNAHLNGLDDGVEVYGSLGYHDLRRPHFDLIACNVPGKAGTPVIEAMLRGAARHLTPNGRVAIVVVAPLEPLVRQTIAALPSATILVHDVRRAHAVVHYAVAGTPQARESDETDLSLAVYRRATTRVIRGELEYRLETAFGLPEFESPSYSTDLLLDALLSGVEPDIRHAAVFNPGQGHAAVALSSIAAPATMTIVDRDLLALRFTARNLRLNGAAGATVVTVHQPGFAVACPDPIDLLLGTLREDEGKEAIAQFVAQAAQQMAPGGTALLAGGSTAITRVVKILESRRYLDVLSRKRRFGSSLLVARKTATE